MNHLSNYVGVKFVSARPMSQRTYNDYRGHNQKEREEGEEVIDGYLVVYSDGYESWCPKAQFEEANRLVTGMTYGHAIESIKLGKKVARKGWNNPNIWIEAQLPDENSKMTMPYIYMTKNGERFPMDLTCESIFADDWEIVE